MRADGDSPGAPSARDQWRTLLDEMRRARGKKFLRVSRKMLNHLCSIGLPEAQAMLEEVEGPTASADEPGANMPGSRIALEGSVLTSGAPFELAARYLGDEEILGRIRKWLQDDKASFFSTVVGDPRSTMPEVADAIRRYHDVLLGRSGLPQSTLKSLRVSLIQRFLT